MEVFVYCECQFREGTMTFNSTFALNILLLTAALRLQQYLTVVCLEAILL